MIKSVMVMNSGYTEVVPGRYSDPLLENRAIP